MSRLIIRTPPWRSVERGYTLTVVFRDWLGIPFDVVVEDREDTSISLQTQGGEPNAPSIRLPDDFLKTADDLWLDPATLPTGPFDEWDTRHLGVPALVTDPMIPILFGEGSAGELNSEDGSMNFPIDVIGATFFMLSRYEEVSAPVRDEHDRFPATASVAYRGEFLHRPIIDEYVELLWAALKRTWPSLRRRAQSPRTLVSCDVDFPFLTIDRPLRGLQRIVGDVVRRRSPRSALRTSASWLDARRGDYSRNAFRYNLDWIMDVNEAANRPVAFNFIPEVTNATYDPAPSLDEPRMRSLLRDISARGHEIGFHPGYDTYRSPDAFAKSLAKLRQVLDDEGIAGEHLGGRQHFLRWETPTTALLWDVGALTYDSTLGFADSAGFRCGTCQEFTLFDVIEGTPLRVLERPLIVMDVSVTSRAYGGLGHGTHALVKMQRLKSACDTVRGNFTLLWHNSYFNYPGDRKNYAELVGGKD